MLRLFWSGLDIPRKGGQRAAPILVHGDGGGLVQLNQLQNYKGEETFVDGEVDRVWLTVILYPEFCWTDQEPDRYWLHGKLPVRACIVSKLLIEEGSLFSELVRVMLVISLI